MGKRTDLQKELELIIGSRNVYFQPPEGFRLKYPCIVYQRSTANTMYGDNNPYIIRKRYEVILIDENPDSEFFDKIIAMQSCSHERHYNSEGLNHDVFYLYY